MIGTEIKTIAKNSQHEYMSFQSQIKDACEKNNQIVHIFTIIVFP